MGNCLFSCFHPAAEKDCYEEFAYNHIENRRDLPRFSNYQESCAVYTIEDEINDMPEFRSFASQSTLNDYRISNDLYNMNLTEMSREIKCFQSTLSMDSGFATLSRVTSVAPVDLSSEMASIRLDTVAKYTSNLANNLYIKSLSYCYNLINISLSNLPFLLKTSGNHRVASKRGLGKVALFSPMFISLMKGKSLLKKVEQRQEVAQTCEETSEQISIVVVNEKKVNIDTGNIGFGVSTVRSFFTRIYDVNFF
jgi:hypothetical protein